MQRNQPDEITMVADTLRSKWQRPGVVVVSPQGSGAVRPHVRGGEARHCGQTLTVGCGHGTAARVSGNSCRKKELGDQAVISRRCLEVHTILMNLKRDFPFQLG